MNRLTRWLILSVAAGGAWYAGMRIVFWPLQAILADPELQSEKFLAVFFEVPPAPRMAASAWVLPLGLLITGAAFAAAFVWLRPAGNGTIKSGLKTGAAAWLFMVPWFEFYLPWNVMHEPFALVLVEAAAWLVVLSGVGLAVAVVDLELLSRFVRTGQPSTGR